MLDPRVSMIEKQLAGVREIVAVASGKGGVGKSSVAAVAALMLAKRGMRVGLLDLDFHGPSAHILLGAPGEAPAEDRGIVPPLVHGVSLMSVVFYAGTRPIPIRGDDLTNAMIELLAITRWGELDVLLVDMPPGVGDPTLDAIRYLPRASYLVVSTPSRLAWETVERLLALLDQCGAPLRGIVQNMCRGDTESMPATGHADEVAHVRYDGAFEAALGDPGRLVATQFAQDIEEVVESLEAARVGV